MSVKFQNLIQIGKCYILLKFIIIYSIFIMFYHHLHACKVEPKTKPKMKFQTQIHKTVIIHTPSYLPYHYNTAQQ